MGTNPGVDIVNAPLGSPGFQIFLQAAIRSALTLDILTVAAIGNNGRNGVGNHGSPGNYPEVLGVGATDISDVVADFSDWGDQAPPVGPAYPLPGISAPGVDVSSSVPGGGFQRMSGTSMATPVVTGVAALRMEANPALKGNPAALRLDLLSRFDPCTSNPAGNKGGVGRIKR